jgi:hypothetical protein
MAMPLLLELSNKKEMSFTSGEHTKYAKNLAEKHFD